MFQSRGSCTYLVTTIQFRVARTQCGRSIGRAKREPGRLIQRSGVSRLARGAWSYKRPPRDVDLRGGIRPGPDKQWQALVGRGRWIDGWRMELVLLWEEHIGWKVDMCTNGDKGIMTNNTTLVC